MRARCGSRKKLIFPPSRLSGFGRPKSSFYMDANKQRVDEEGWRRGLVKRCEMLRYKCWRWSCPCINNEMLQRGPFPAEEKNKERIIWTRNEWEAAVWRFYLFCAGREQTLSFKVHVPSVSIQHPSAASRTSAPRQENILRLGLMKGDGFFLFYHNFLLFAHFYNFT